MSWEWPFWSEDPPSPLESLPTNAEIRTALLRLQAMIAAFHETPDLGIAEFELCVAYGEILNTENLKPSTRTAISHAVIPDIEITMSRLRPVLTEALTNDYRE